MFVFSSDVLDNVKCAFVCTIDSNQNLFVNITNKFTFY